MMSVKTGLVILPFVLPLYLLRVRFNFIPTTILELYLLVLFGVFMWELGWKGWREGWQRLGSWRWPVAAWFLVTLMEALFAPHVLAGLGLWRAYVLEPLLMFVAVMSVIHSSEDARAMRRSFFLIVIGLAVWAAIQFLTGLGIPHPWDVAIAAGRRATGPFPYPNALSLFIAPLGIWAFGEWMRSKDILNCVTWITAAVAILLAKSEGGAIAFTAIAIAFLLAKHRTRRWTLAVIAAVSLIIFATPQLRQSLWRELSFQGWSGKVRLYMWRDTFTMLKDHPLFGAGFGGYPTVFKAYQRTHGIEIFQYPHNIILNLWSETGLVGLLVFAWIVWTWVFNSRRSSRIEDRLVCLAPLLVVVIHGLVDVPYFKNDLAIEFWMLAALMTSELTPPPSAPPLTLRGGGKIT